MLKNEKSASPARPPKVSPVGLPLTPLHSTAPAVPVGPKAGKSNENGTPWNTKPSQQCKFQKENVF